MPALRSLVAALASLGASHAWAQGAPFPKAIDHVLQLRTMPQHQSNPGRLSDDDDRRRGSHILVNSIGGAITIPLLSNETRLELAGNLADARYSGNSQLSHQPKTFNAGLPWRAGRLFTGRIDYSYSDRLYDYLDRVWPERDMVQRQRLQAQFGVRATENLTLPLVSVFQGRERYDVDINRTLYNSNETGWQAGFAYRGIRESYYFGGFRQSRVEYIDRTDAWRVQIDDAYRDNEIFLGGQWDITAKTAFEARVGVLRRSYATLGERDTTLYSIDTRSTWNYSPKTRFDVYLYRRPYANNDDPDILYSTLTGARFAVRWKASPKTALWLNVAREEQDDTRISGLQGDKSIWRFGSRLEWIASSNVRVMLDGYRQREQGLNAADSFSQNVVRLGLEFSTDSGSRAPYSLLDSSECFYRSVEYLLCDVQNAR